MTLTPDTEAFGKNMRQAKSLGTARGKLKHFASRYALSIIGLALAAGLFFWRFA